MRRGRSQVAETQFDRNRNRPAGTQDADAERQRGAAEIDVTGESFTDPDGDTGQFRRLRNLNGKPSAAEIIFLRAQRATFQSPGLK